MTFEKSLKDKVAEWLSKEGYPLEYLVTNIFRSSGFHAVQGRFARADNFDSPREIDVSVWDTNDINNSFARVYQLIECKWSQDKPWVIFTDRSRIAPAALIAQSIASGAGTSALWVQAGTKQLHDLDFFRIPAGFGGRQVFGQKPDQFYSAIQSIVEKSIAVAESYDKDEDEPHKSMYCVVVFPMIVVSGPLFSAAYNEKTKEVELNEVDRIRVLWIGARRWDRHIAVDIVSIGALPEICEKRKKELPILLNLLAETVKKFHECFEKRSLEPPSIERASRGLTGTPYIIRKIREHIAAQALDKI